MQERPKFITLWVYTPEHLAYNMLKHLYYSIYFIDMHATMTQNYFNRALEYYNNKQIEKAKKCVLKNIKLNPSHINSLKLIAYIEFQKRHFKQSLKYLNTAFKLNPYLSEINNLIGCIYLEYGEFGKSVDYFTRCIVTEPTYADAYINLINCYHKLEEIELAVTTYKKGEIHLKEDISFHLRCANIFYSNNQFVYAIQIYQHIINNDNNTTEAFWKISKCYLALQDVEPVLSILKELKDLSFQSVNVRMNISNELLHYGYSDYAIEEYHSLVDLYSDSAALYNNIASAYDHLEKTDKAIEYFEKSIKKNENYVPARSNFGRVLTDINRLDEAETMLKRALQSEPNNVNALINLGRLYEIMCKPSRSLETLNIALGLSSQNPIVHSNLGNAYHQLGQFEKSCEHYKTCLSLDPDYEDAEQNLGINELAMGKFDTAWGHYFKRIRHLKRGESLSSITPGMSFNGKRVYFCRSQGIGDELFFLRFLPILKKQNVTICYRSSEKIYPLLTNVPEIDLLINEDEKIPDCDYYFTIDDLPLILNINNINQIPESIRFNPNPNTVREITEILTDYPRPYIGITWRAGTQSNAKFNREKQRNLNKHIPIDELGDILQPMEGSVVILQRNPNNDELEKLQNLVKQPIINLSEYNNSLEDMLALLSIIDTHFGVSNTNIHLCAALGKKANVLIPFPPDWRWMTKGDTSPWFPGFGVYRQKSTGDWKQAIRSLMDSLKNYAVK